MKIAGLRTHYKTNDGKERLCKRQKINCEIALLDNEQLHDEAGCNREENIGDRNDGFGGPLV